MSRRWVLRGTGGVALGLPLLESLLPRNAFAQAGSRPRFAVFMRQANGVAQESGGEPERFFPRALGPITTASLSTTDADRAVSELKDYAGKLLIVRGLRFGFPGNGCGHSGGGNQCLTAARVSDTPSGNRSLAMGESVDNRIARELAPGSEPLTLYAGRMGGYIDEVLSYRGAKDLRSAEENPYNAYVRMVGLTGADSATQLRVAKARQSVNDLVRGQMTALLSTPQLSKDDKKRLDLHFSSIRDLEVRMSCTLPEMKVQAMQAVAQGDQFKSNDRLEEVARMQSDLIALAFSCGYARSATLQIGDGNDQTEYTVNGTKQPNYHFISHRVASNGGAGDPIPDAQEKHHQVDRIHGRMFKYLLDRLSAVGVLDDTAAVWTNDLANGPGHSYSDVPFIIAGSAGGYLRTGRYVNAGNVTHNKLFNTLLNAVGCKKADGSPVDDFGDSSLARGELSELKA